jgi:voltage-gated potassium channel
MAINNLRSENKKMKSNLKLFFNELSFLIRSPFFVMLTMLGNSFILFCGYLFWLIEHDVNPKVQRYMDAIWWGFATATTTGYGDVTPVTDLGKILSIILMLSGLAIFAMYTALFSETIMQHRVFFLNKRKKD